MILSYKFNCRALLFLFLVAGVPLAMLPAMGQQGEAIPQPGANLPSESRAVIERLESLHALPDGPWKMHVGDVQHGEETDLDDSQWQTVALNSKAPNAAVWFRQTIQIPRYAEWLRSDGLEDLVSVSCQCQWPGAGDSLFQWSSCCVGEDLEPEILFDSAHPGDKVVVAVKLLHTVDTKEIRGATLAVEFPASRPNPVDLSQEFLSAALLVPTLDAVRRSRRDESVAHSMALLQPSI